MENGFIIENGIMTGYRGPGGDVSVPEGVAHIGSEAFSGCAEIERIAFPSSLETIGDYAFMGCSGLTELIFPKGLRFIDRSAFSRCTGLKRLKLPEKLTGLGEFAFSGCRGLTELTLPAGLARIDRSAFSQCRGLTRIALPEALERLEQSVFFGCVKLREVEIPGEMRAVDAGAFTGCDSLTRISVAPDNAWLKDIGGVLYSRDGTRLLLCPGGLQEIAVPEGVTEIGPLAFCDNRNLDRVTLPSGLRTIGAAAFRGCAELAEIALPEGLQSIGEAAFESCKRLRRLALPDSVAEIGDSALRNCPEMQWMKLPEGVPFSLGWFCAPHDSEHRSADKTIVPFANTRRIGEIGSDMGARRAALGFIRAELDGVRTAEEIARGYTDYIRAHGASFREELLAGDDILAWMTERRMIPPEDVEGLLSEASERGNAAASVLLLDYQNKITLQAPTPGGELETRFAALENAF